METTQATFWKKLSVMLDSGVRLADGLEVLAGDLPGEAAGRALAEVLEDLRRGETFAAALARHPELFATETLEMVRGGEANARLGEIARLIGESLEARVGSAVEPGIPVGGDPGSGEMPPEIQDLFRRAHEENATDIHLDATGPGGRVRFRVDGRLRTCEELDRPTFERLIRQVKAVTGMDLAESRLPQDGRFRLALGEDRETFEVRVSTGPTVLGESACMRPLRLEKVQAILKNPQKIFADKVLRAEVFEAASRPFGLFVTTGPTGCGKTTTTYALLSRLDAEGMKIMSVEDPVEWQLPGVQQVQVQPRLGLTFARALRQFMLQDPDVVNCGEVRDVETAMHLVRLALTGHQVFTQLHAPDTLTALQRLVDIGVEPFTLGDALVGILAQRLVRLLCSECRLPAPEHTRRLRELAGPDLASDIELMGPAGCPRCFGTGYRGRRALFEFLPMGPGIRRVLHGRPEPEVLERAVRESGRRTFLEGAIPMLASGELSLLEVLRVVPPPPGLPALDA